MTDFHHNIFYYYNGAKMKDSDRELQLEDNTTKALINTLKHSRPEVAREFLSWLGIEANNRPTFELQRKNIGTSNIRSKSRRLLLGITQIKDDKNPHIEGAEVDNKSESRPDAWIYGEDFVVLIESKVGNHRLSKVQMDSHSQKLLGNHKTLHKMWGEIYQFFKRLPASLTLGDKDRWLIEQFTEYLEWNNMAEFTGFENELFEYFVTQDDTKKKWVRDTIKAFAEKIIAELQQLDTFYQGYDIGNLKIGDESSWVAFGPTQPRKNEYRWWAHQSIAVNVNGLEIFVNVELKDAMLLLRKRLNKQERKFRKLISELPGTFFIQIDESKQKQPFRFEFYTLAKLEGGLLKEPLTGPYGIKDAQSEGFNYIEHLLQPAERPCLSVRRLLPRKNLIIYAGKDGQALVTEVIHIMQAFHPLVAFINDDEQEYTQYREKKLPKPTALTPANL